MSEFAHQIEENLRSVEARVASAAIRAGRLAKDVTLVAVTKYAQLEWVRELIALGQRNLGENRPQQLCDRAEQLPHHVDWHLIGHLQSNKAKRLLPVVRWIHSIDSLKLLKSVDRLAHESGAQTTELDAGEVPVAKLADKIDQPGKTFPRLKILMEVNITGEVSKDGFTPEELRRDWEAVCACQNVEILGLMTMAAATENPEDARPTFRALRELRDELQLRSSDRIILSQLSMGMTGDFEVAIEEGATLVRIGSALFQGLS